MKKKYFLLLYYLSYLLDVKIKMLIILNYPN